MCRQKDAVCLCRPCRLAACGWCLPACHLLGLALFSIGRPKAGRKTCIAPVAWENR